MVIRVTIIVTFVGWHGEGHEGASWGARDFLHIDLCAGYTGIYIYKT